MGSRDETVVDRMSSNDFTGRREVVSELESSELIVFKIVATFFASRAFSVSGSTVGIGFARKKKCSGNVRGSDSSTWSGEGVADGTMELDFAPEESGESDGSGRLGGSGGFGESGEPEGFGGLDESGWLDGWATKSFRKFRSFSSVGFEVGVRRGSGCGGVGYESVKSSLSVIRNLSTPTILSDFILGCRISSDFAGFRWISLGFARRNGSEW